MDAVPFLSQQKPVVAFTRITSDAVAFTYCSATGLQRVS